MNMATSETPAPQPRVAFLVNNPCAPDHRVIKQAEALVKAGCTVRIFCKAQRGVPIYENIRSVEYIRLGYQPRKQLVDLFLFWRKK